MVRKLALSFAFLAIAAACVAQVPVTGAPNHGIVTPSAQNQVAIYSNSGTAKTVSGDANLTDSSGKLIYSGGSGIQANGGVNSSGATGGGDLFCAQGTEISPPAAQIGIFCPATITTPYLIIPPGAPAGDTLNRLVTWTQDGTGNENLVVGAPTPQGCNSACNYVLTTADSPSGPGSAGSTISTANQGQYIQFFNNAQRKVGNACVQVSTLSSGGHFDVGLYSISGTTGTLQWHTGSQSTAATGAICVTPTAYTLLPGNNYYVAWCADNTTSVIEALTGEAVIAAAGPAHTAGVDATDTCTSGVLPSTITTTNIANTNTHLMIPYVLVSD